jgi:hypothetical protein
VEGDDSDPRTDADFDTWHVYDAGGPVLRLTVRFRQAGEVPDWRDGPDLFEALRRAAADGWEAYDREPGEYAIYHLKRESRAERPSPDVRGAVS